MRVSGCRRCVLQGVEHWTDCSWVTEVGPPPPLPGSRSQIWCTSAEQTRCSLIKMCKVVLKRRRSSFTVTQISDLARLWWIHKGGRLRLQICVTETRWSAATGWKEMKSFLFLCVSLVCPHFSFTPIRKPDEFSPPLCLSSLLHSADNCFNLHLSALLSVYCTPPADPQMYRFTLYDHYEFIKTKINIDVLYKGGVMTLQFTNMEK